MGVAIPAGMAGPGSEFTANAIILQGHPMGSLLLSPEDGMTPVGRDKGGSKKGNEKRGWEAFTDEGKKKGGKKRAKREHMYVFRTAGISLADLKLRE